MSAELTDFRGKITSETHAVLEALSQATGRDRSEIVREWLHDRALEQIHTANVLQRQLQAKGLAREPEGADSPRASRRGAK